MLLRQRKHASIQRLAEEDPSVAAVGDGDGESTSLEEGSGGEVEGVEEGDGGCGTTAFGDGDGFEDSAIGLKRKMFEGQFRGRTGEEGRGREGRKRDRRKRDGERTLRKARVARSASVIGGGG